MRLSYPCIVILALAIFCAGCASRTGYQQASARHYAYASGEKPATPAEWHALIADFERIIETDAQGEFADDAQYAIASSYVWCVKAGDTAAPQQAIAALEQLANDYSDSPHVPHAHYWQGRCYAHIDDTYQAITQYQLVMNRYADSDVAEDAQLALARAYAKQGYATRAESLYKNLVAGAKKEEIVAAASEEMQGLKPEARGTGSRAPADKRVAAPPRVQKAKAPKASTVKKNAPALRRVAPETLTRQFGLTAKTIVIDAGHGGKDPGALGAGERQEKIVVLSIAKKLREKLTAKGYKVLLTREDNTFIALKGRTQFATQNRADLFISIHANANKNSKANGIETYYLDVASTDKAAEGIAARENADSGYSIQELNTLLKGLVQESKSADSQRLATAVQKELIRATGAVDRGVKHARFVVLIGTSVPAILVETGFISNPTEGKNLMSAAYQQKIAGAIALGIDKFLGKKPGEPLAERR